MESIQQKFYEKYAGIQTKLIRDFINQVDWSNRFIGIKGNRGVGKTTLLLQYIKLNYKPDNKVLYVSLDSIYFSDISLYIFADTFYKKGGQLLVVDEIHRYKNWSLELKNIFDDMPELKVIFTGSSLLELRKGKSDLSRRVVMYEMPGLSYREFLQFDQNIVLPKYNIETLINNHIEISSEIINKIKPLEFFDSYLNYGYYPFFKENKNSFHLKLSEVLLTVLEVDIPQFEEIQISNIAYLKKLLHIISNSVPFKPNMNALSSRTGISINTMKNYLKYLNDANIISMLYVQNKEINSLNKPEKIYLNDTNLIHNLASNKPDIGNLRETFFYNQLKQNNTINASKESDFVINKEYTFEIGGYSKNGTQIKGIEKSFVVKDGIEIGVNNTIPLWMFGFLY